MSVTVDSVKNPGCSNVRNVIASGCIRNEESVSSISVEVVSPVPGCVSCCKDPCDCSLTEFVWGIFVISLLRGVTLTTTALRLFAPEFCDGDLVEVMSETAAGLFPTTFLRSVVLITGLLFATAFFRRRFATGRGDGLLVGAFRVVRAAMRRDCFGSGGWGFTGVTTGNASISFTAAVSRWNKP